MTATTYEQLVRQVHDLLATAEGRERISARREHATKMAKGLRRWTDELKNGRMRYRGAVLTITQGGLERALGRDGALTVSVEVNGIGVGQIVFSPTQQPLFFSTDAPTTGLVWSGDAVHGAKIRAYLKQRRSSKSMPERHVQGHMSARFRALFDGGESPPGGLVPVRPAGCMMEIPTAVAASKTLQVGGGAIDILARTGRGRSGWFIACELKKLDSTERPADVLRQAIRYATALDIEVNGRGLLPPADAAIYRELFGGSGTAAIRFGALAAIATANRDQVRDAFIGLAAPKEAWLGALLYTQEGKQLRAELMRP